MRRFRVARVLGALVAVAMAGACHGGSPHSPEAAFRALRHAVERHDADALYHALDEHTRWDVETAWRYEHQMGLLVQSSYPAGPDREAALRKYGAAAQTSSGHELFVAEANGDAGDVFASLAAARSSRFDRFEMLPPDPNHPGARAKVLTRAGVSLPFAENDDGTWGYEGFAAVWHARVVRDSHELVTVKENAALYRGASPASAHAPAAGEGARQ